MLSALQSINNLIGPPLNGLPVTEVTLDNASQTGDGTLAQ